MKNIFRFLMAVAVLFTASCAKEDISSSIGGGEVEVTFTANLPELGTRAYGDGTQVNKLRYYVYDNDGTLLEGLSNTTTGVDIEVGKTTTVNLVLLKGMKYNILFWADNGSDIYSINGGVVSIDPTTEIEANDESRDAFFAALENFDPVSVSGTKDVTLTRPFAQLNAIVTNMAEVGKSFDLNASGAYIKSTIETTIYTSFNAFTGVVGGKTDATIKFSETEVENFAQGHLSMNYLFPPSELSEVTFYFKGAKFETNTTINNIPLKANYKTNIIGKLLTASTDFEVTIDPVFDTPDKDIVQTAAELQQQIENAQPGKPTEIVLGNDINLNDLLASLGTMSTRAEEAPLPIVIPETKKIILDLNGCRIDAPVVEGNNSKHYYAFENHGTLTIKDTKGNGVINARGNFNYGTMTVESGTINAIDGNGGYGVRNYEGAAFIMNGGKIATTNEDDNLVNNGGSDATTLRVDEGATATINGGVVNNICDYTFAIDNYGDTTVKAGTFTSIHSTVSTYGVMTIDGGTFICNGLEGITAHALVAWDGSETTINGGTFDGKDNYNGFNVDADEGATVYIKGGLFMPVHSGSLYGDGNIVVSGGKFFDKIKDSRLADGCTLVQEQEGDYWTINFTPAAKIGETTYNTLQDAIEAVEDGETIIVNRNATFNEGNRMSSGGTWYEGVYYVGDKSFTIDLNNNTISQNGAVNDYMFLFKNDGEKANTITFKNGTIDAGTNAYCALCTSTTSTQKITINLEGVNLVGNNSNGAVAKIRGGAELNVKTGTVITGKNNYVGIEAAGNNTVVNIYEGAKIYQKGTSSYVGSLAGASGGATINVYGGEGVSAMGGFIVMTSGGTVNVSGGEWIANTDGTGANSNKSVLIAQSDKQYNAGATNSVVNVTGGTFKGGFNCYGNAVGDAQINITGGNFNADPSAYVVAGKAATENNGTWTIIDAVSTAEDLVAALAQGGVVTLGADITVSDTIVVPEGVTATLNLNGKTLAHKDVETNYALNNHGTLTIKGNGTVNARGIYNGYDADGNYVATAKLIIENGTFNAKGTNGGAAVYNYGTAEIKGGKFESNGGYGLNNQAGGTLSVNDATVKGGIYNVGTLTINNSTIDQHISGRHAIYNWQGNVTINSGNFDSKSGNELILADGQDASVVINGGTFNKTAKSWLFGAATGKNISFVINGGTHNGYVNKPEMTVDTIRPYGDPIVVTGGTFNFNPKQWLAEGKTATQNANGTWTVSK